MARCEDFPCCGHELGCCPDFDPDTGEQLNMVCTCGAKLPVTSRYSVCRGCLSRPDPDEPEEEDDEDFDHDPDDLESRDYEYEDFYD